MGYVLRAKGRGVLAFLAEAVKNLKSARATISRSSSPKDYSSSLYVLKIGKNKV